MKVIHGLLVYRRFIAEQPIDDFQPIKQKMEEIIRIERARGDGYDSIDESVGKINPNEPDAIQAFRRALRRDGKALRTERSYVGKLKAFMAERAIDLSGRFSFDHRGGRGSSFDRFGGRWKRRGIDSERRLPCLVVILQARFET